MTYQFSFSNKKELVYIENKPWLHNIGGLLKTIIDTDWASLIRAVQTASTLSKEDPNGSFTEIKEDIRCCITHPAVSFAVQKTETVEALLGLLEKNQRGKDIALRILESLVDEEQSSYEEVLLGIITADEIENDFSFVSSLETANILSFKERNSALYQNTDDFPFLFETNDLMTIVFQELEYICLNRFYIRKCAHCKRFIWTKKMNRIYCDRVVSDNGKTCAQVGPSASWRSNNSKAYALYWAYRTRLFNRVDDEQNNYFYHRWLKETEDLRDRAKKDLIPIDDMKEALDKIESNIYQESICV